MTSPAARVAVCIPTRNRAGYLRQAIESAQRRFLTAHENRLDDPSALRQLLGKSARRELVNVTRNLTKSKRPVGKALRPLWQPGHLDSRVAVEPGHGGSWVPPCSARGLSPGCGRDDRPGLLGKKVGEIYGIEAPLSAR